MKMISPNPGYGSSGWDNDIDDQGVYNPSSPNYAYDPSGNLVQDNQEGIEQIVWDLYGKVEAINRTTAAASAGKANLSFMYDALGNRTKKQVMEDPYSATPEVHETWYVRDPQGNILANYERFVEGDSLFLYLTERPIYGSARIGVNMRRVKLSASLANQYDPPARAMQITALLYDSPQSHKDAPEINDGEYIVLQNLSNDTLDLGAYRMRNLLQNTSWTMTGLGTLAPGKRMMIGNYPSSGAGGFKAIALITDELLKDGDISLAGGLGITLPDSAGSIVLEDTAGTLQDRLDYGPYFQLEAANAYVPMADLDTLEKRAPLNAVYRTAGLAKPIGGNSPQVWVISTTGTMTGAPALGAYPAPYTGSETGTYALERGGTAYEFTNHLGNVLAVVSDKKLGQDTDADLHAEYYHPETMMLTDYYPFGMAMVGRTWQSGTYRYGFNGMQKDNEVVGEANGYDFGARLYDGRVGRWWSVDPKSWEFPQSSPYVSNGNNPILFIDIGGKQIYVSGSSTHEQEMLDALTRITGFKIEVEGGKLVAKGKVSGGKIYGQEILDIINTKDVIHTIGLGNLGNEQNRVEPYNVCGVKDVQIFDEDVWTDASDLFIGHLFAHELNKQLNLVRRVIAANKGLNKDKEKKKEKKDLRHYTTDHKVAEKRDVDVVRNWLMVTFGIENFEAIQGGTLTLNGQDSQIAIGYLDKKDNAIMFKYYLDEVGRIFDIKIYYTKNYPSNHKEKDGITILRGEHGEQNDSYKEVEK